MPYIKVTGYIDVEELEPDQFDPTNEMGLSLDGYEALVAEFNDSMDDVSFKLVEEMDE